MLILATDSAPDLIPATRCRVCGSPFPLEALTHDARGVSFHPACYEHAALGFWPETPHPPRTDLAALRAQAPEVRYGHDARRLMTACGRIVQRLLDTV